ncbi:MAG: T9SS type A sorting domain-containing protein, partial [Muribaculaceae bacterium]|nr:T9SS type A sorting domain-containing protein [Muribaculaceae bacterium]
NWDFFWSRLNNQGQFIADQIDTAWGGRVGSGTEGSRLFYRYDDARIPENTWTHVVIVFEYSGNSLREKLYINGVLQTVGCYIRVHKGNAEGILGSEDGLWSQLERCQSLAENGVYGTNTTEPAYCPSTYPLESSHWIAFGGSASKIASLDGYIDEFQVWGKAMTDADVLTSMKGLDSNNLPADILGFWDFESAPASDYGFTGHTGSNATYKSPKCYFWREAATGNEGQGGKVFLNPVFNAGSPSIKGNYAINTTPVWNTGRSATISGSGTGTSGSYTISWAKPRDYEVELTLSNPHGTDTRKYPVISVVDGLAGIGSIGADSDGFNTYVESNTVFVEFASDGLYNVEVYNASGMQVGLCRQQFTAGQNAQINLSQAGVYFVKVVKDGTLLRTVKVLVK